VTLPVIDVLEVVDVDHSQAQRLIAPVRVREAALKLELPRPPVAQASQRVGVGQTVQPVQQPLALELLVADMGNQRLDRRAHKAGYGDEQNRRSPSPRRIVPSTADDQRQHEHDGDRRQHAPQLPSRSAQPDPEHEKQRDRRDPRLPTSHAQ
jgi:hypothetical protein